jgi:AcrR family transcriptional regulator
MKKKPAAAATRGRASAATNRSKPSSKDGGRRSGSATRERILQVATELFANKGYHATGVAEIGDSVGIKRAALYYHIGSKEELLNDVVREHVELILANTEEIAASDLDDSDKLRELARRHLRVIVGHRQEVAVVLRDVTALGDQRLGDVRKMQRRIETLWQQVIKDGVAAGTFRSADPMIARGFLSMLNMAYAWYRPTGALTPDGVADRFTDLLLDGMLTEQARKQQR